MTQLVIFNFGRYLIYQSLSLSRIRHIQDSDQIFIKKKAKKLNPENSITFRYPSPDRTSDLLAEQGRIVVECLMATICVGKWVDEHIESTQGRYRWVSVFTDLVIANSLFRFRPRIDWYYVNNSIAPKAPSRNLSKPEISKSKQCYTC